MANARRLGYVGKQPGRRDSDSWFTPPQYVLAVWSVLGTVDLDPFSSVAANRVVQARRFYTEADNAFVQDWTARTVFMNPPYGKLCRRAVEKFVEEYRCGSFQSGIVLVNNATETRMGQLLLQTAKACCFTNHRISFANVDGKRISGNTRGQIFCYFGTKRSLFRRVFAQFGCVL